MAFGGPVQATSEERVSGQIVGEAVGAAMELEAVRELGTPGARGGHGETACLNCGTMLSGPFCHQCGQAGHVHRTLMAFVHDLLHGVFHFEGRIWRTIPLLLVRPGQLTRDYIAGHRVRHVSPIALFLFSVFLLFLVVKHAPEGVENNVGIAVNGKKITGLAANEAEVARLAAERRRLLAAHRPTEAIDGEIAGRKAVLDKIRASKSSLANQLDRAFKSADRNGHYSDIPELDAGLARLRANPELAIYKLESNAYKYAWALIPFSVPLVWLLFPFSRRFGLYDHTVFVTYSLCAMSLLVVALSLMSMGGVPGVTLLALCYPPWHMYRQIKGTYGLSRFGALWRTIALLSMAVTAMVLFGLTLALLEVAA